MQKTNNPLLVKAATAIGSTLGTIVAKIKPTSSSEDSSDRTNDSSDRTKLMEHLRLKTYALGASIPHKRIRGRRPARARRAS